MQLVLKNLVKKYQQGKNIQPVVYEEDWSDKLEPYAAGLGLAGDAVGLGTAATGVGIPVGTIIAGVANVPNLIIDGYQTIRDGYRTYKDNGASLGSAAWNTGEFVLDAAGLKFLSYINKSRKAGIASAKAFTGSEKAATSSYKRVGTGAGRVMARKSAERKAAYNAARNKAFKESNEELAKKGVRASQGAYYEQKLADAMAKRGYGVAVNDAIKSVNRTARQNLGIVSGISAGTNVYHLQKKQGGKMQLLKNGSGIHIKKKNRGKFTDYCGGKVTDSCIKKAKASGNPTLVKRATFAANARKWKHEKGGSLKTGVEIGGALGQTIVNTEAKRKNKIDSAHNWFKQRYGNVNWNNMKYIYNQMKKARIPYDTAIAVMGNIIHESQGDPHKRQIGGGPGYGLIQWNIGTQPGDTLEAQTAGIIQNIINPANQNNYWYHGGEGSGFKSGEEVRRYMNKKNNYEFSKKTKAFSDSLLRPGKPELEDRIKSSRSLAALTDLFPEYLKGGQINE